MATCAFCKTKETALYESGVPICLSCANAKDAKAKGAMPQSVPKDPLAAYMDDRHEAAFDEPMEHATAEKARSR